MRLFQSLKYMFSAMILTLILSCGGTHSPAQSGGAYPVNPVPEGWSILGPGGGGSTFIPVFHPTIPERMIIRCDMTGSYLSSDNGESWRMLNFPGGVSSFAFDSRHPDDVYVGGRGLYRSRDNGNSWDLLFPNPASVTEVFHRDDHAGFNWRSDDNYPGGSVSAILVDPEDSRKIYLGINGGGRHASALYVSTDAGAGWTEASTFDSPVLGLFHDPADPGRLIAFCRSSLNIWEKGSGTVESRPHPEQMSSVVSVSGGIDPERPGLYRLWAVSAPGRLGENLPGRVFASEDKALSWNEVTGKIAGGNPVAPGSQPPSFVWIASSQGDSRSAYLVCSRYIQRDEQGNDGFWYGIFRTADAGENWHWVYKAGGGSGRYGVRDGKEADNLRDSWVRDAFSGDFILAICTAVSPADPERAIFTDWYRSMKTEDGGGTWNALYSKNLPDGSVVSRGQDVTTCYGLHFDPFDPRHIAISYTDIGYFHSFDGGESWFRSLDGVPRRWENTVYWMEFDPEVKGRLWSVWSSWHDIPRFKMIRSPRWKNAATGGVCVSDDGGRTWRVANEGLPENSPTTFITLDPSSPADNRTLYVTAYGQGVYKSTDGGMSWQQKNRGLEGNLNVWEIKLVDSRTLYLVVTPALEYGEEYNELISGGVFRSEDAGESWTRLPVPSEVKFPNSIEFDPSDPDRLYLACWADLDYGDFGGRGADGASTLKNPGGVLLSEDRGATWTRIFDEKAYVYAVTVDPNKPGRTYLVTFHNGAYRSDDHGKTWGKIDGYNFYWGHRAVPDIHDPEKIYITTFGGSLFHGKPTVGGKL